MASSAFETQFNAGVAWCARRGISIAGARLLAVSGRKSGRRRTTPVNVLVLDGARYLLAPRGATQWVRNARATPGAELLLGRCAEPVLLDEVTGAAQVPVIRAYLRRWGWQVRSLVGGIDARSSDAELLDAAPRLPVFRVVSP